MEFCSVTAANGILRGAVEIGRISSSPRKRALIQRNKERRGKGEVQSHYSGRIRVYN